MPIYDVTDFWIEETCNFTNIESNLEKIHLKYQRKKLFFLNSLRFPAAPRETNFLLVCMCFIIKTAVITIKRVSTFVNKVENPCNYRKCQNNIQSKGKRFVVVTKIYYFKKNNRNFKRKIGTNLDKIDHIC